MSPKTTISIQQSTSHKIQETKKSLNQLGIKTPSADAVVDFALHCLNQGINPTQEENLREEFKNFQIKRIEEAN